MVAWNAVVVGAGPAGVVAAHVLARAGRRVLLLDRVDRGRAKIGEALPGAASRLLASLDLPVPGGQGPHRRIGGNLSTWATDEWQAVDFLRDPDGAGWRLDRPRFDADLREAAIRSGAEFRAAFFVGAQRRGDAWQVQTDDGAIEETHWLIDASGRRAAVARRLGARRWRDDRLVALYRTGAPEGELCLDRTLIEAVPLGWWYGARLPSGAAIAGLHLRPRDAVQLIARPGAWQIALEETHNLARLLPPAAFGSPSRAYEACGARLDRFAGPGWIACGDAALSFDPLSSQGIFSALHGGMSAARSVGAALDGDAGGLDAYAARLNDIRRIYSARRLTLYRSQRRWADAPFWSSFERS